MGKKEKKVKKAKKDKNNKNIMTTKNYINNFNFTNGESFMRMNYLFKLSEVVYNQTNKNNENNNNSDGKNNNNIKEQNILSRLYIAIMKDISKRNAIRVNKFVKKITCQKCNNLLFKDNNSEMKFINKNGKKTLEINCGECHNISEIIYL